MDRQAVAYSMYLHIFCSAQKWDHLTMELAYLPRLFHQHLKYMELKTVVPSYHGDGRLLR